MGLIEQGRKLFQSDGLPPGPMSRVLIIEGRDEDGFPQISQSKEMEVLEWGLKRWNRQRALFRADEPEMTLEELTREQKTLVKDIRLAVSASNTLVEYLSEQNTADFDRWELSHHGHFHDRRIESWIWTLVSNRPEYFKEKNRQLIYSLALFARFHDFMQIEYQRIGMSDSRTGHTSGSALALLAMERPYADILKLADNGKVNPVAHEIITDAALMTLIHGHNRMSDVLAVLTDGEGVVAGALVGEGLIKAFNDGGLDPLTLKFSDFVKLHWKLRKVDDGSFGLTSDFEKIFEAELRAIEGSDKPLYPVISPEIRQRLRIGSDIGLIADDIDKLYPTKFSIWRKMLGAKADGRALFKADADGINFALKKIAHGKSSYEEEAKFLYHDLGRNIYEYLLLARLMTESPYLYGDGADRTRHIFREIVLRSLSNFEAFGIRFLNRDRGLFGEIEIELLDQLQMKIEERQNGGNGGENGREKFPKRLEEIRENLDKEKRIILKRLENKKITIPDKNPEANPEEEFRKVIAEMKSLILSDIFGMSDEEINGELGRNTEEETPFSTYYSLGSKDDMQRIGR